MAEKSFKTEFKRKLFVEYYTQGYQSTGSQTTAQEDALFTAERRGRDAIGRRFKYRTKQGEPLTVLDIEDIKANAIGYSKDHPELEAQVRAAYLKGVDAYLEDHKVLKPQNELNPPISLQPTVMPTLPPLSRMQDETEQQTCNDVLSVTDTSSESKPEEEYTHLLVSRKKLTRMYDLLTLTNNAELPEARDAVTYAIEKLLRPR
jgi:hypothetical protein